MHAAIIISGQNKETFMRKDGVRGEGSQVYADLGAEDLKEKPDGYWRVRVLNLDTRAPVEFTIRIEAK